MQKKLWPFFISYLAFLFYTTSFIFLVRNSLRLKDNQYYILYCTTKIPSINNSLFYARKLIKDTFGKKMITFTLSGLYIEDQKQLVKIQNEVRQTNNDINRVTKIFISDKCTYGTFVELINIMLKTNHQRYIEYENYLYVLSPSKQSKAKKVEIKPIYL